MITNKFLLCSFLFLFMCISAFADDLKYDFEWVDTPIRDIALTISRITHTPITVSGGNFRLTLLVEDLTANEIVDIFERALKSQGWTLTRSESGISVQSLQQGVDLSEGWAVFSLKYSTSEDIMKAVQAALGSSGQVFAIGADQVCVLGSSSVISEISSLVRAVDLPVNSDVERVVLRHLRVSTAIERAKMQNIKCSLIPDYWGHAVILQGDARERIRARAVLSALDHESPALVTRTIPIHRHNPAEMKVIIESLFDDLKTYPAEKQLLVSGPASLVEQAERTIADLDGTAVQVRVECVIASLSDYAFEELGIRLSHLGSVSANLNAAGYDSLLAAGPGLLVDLVSGSVTGAVAAIDEVKRGEVLSAPSLSVLNGHSAKISVGSNVPFIDSKSTDSYGRTEISVVRKDVGVTLNITPRIEGDFIYLDVTQEVSSIDAAKNNAVDLVTDTRLIQSTVKLADGQTIFLGGVKSVEKGEQKERVPVIGWIPLVGEIFTYRKKTEDNRNLVISLRPTIIRQTI